MSASIVCIILGVLFLATAIILAHVFTVYNEIKTMFRKWDDFK